MAKTEPGDGPAQLPRPGGAGTRAAPEDAVFEAMLEGWAQLQHAGWRLQQDVIGDRCRVVRGVLEVTGEYPWGWAAAHVDEWMTCLAAGPGRANASIRVTQSALRMFCDYVTAPRYGWPEVCEARFGKRPVQVCREWNTAAHLAAREGSPDRRPLSRAEVQRFLDFADAQVEGMARHGRRPTSAAYRAATIFKVMYAWGLRRAEAASLDVTDFSRYGPAPELGRFGVLHVRCFRSTGSDAGTRRAVLSVMPWAVEAVGDYVDVIRPRYRYNRVRGRIALWPTKRGGRLAARAIEMWFASYRDALGLDPACATGALRDAYENHLIEAGADPRFVQQQLGRGCPPSAPATNADVAGDFMETEMRKLLDQSISCSDDDEGSGVTQNLGCRWRLREVMADRGMYCSAAGLRPLLAERGLDLTYRQVYWLVTATPRQLSLKVLVALSDIFGCTMEQLIEPVNPARTAGRHATAAGPDAGENIPGIGDFRPRRARVTG